MFVSRRAGFRFAPQLMASSHEANSSAASKGIDWKSEVTTIPKKNPEFNLQWHHRKSLEVATILSLLLTITLFVAIRDIRTQPREIAASAIQLEVAEIPPTEQIKRPPPPPRPVLPIPTESEDLPEDATIESTELNLVELPPPPPPPSEQGDGTSSVFVAYDEPPEIIGGMQALVSALEYPELARRAGIEGVVIVGVLVDEKGKLLDTKIVKPHGSNAGLEEAAIKGLLKMKWKPAYQRDKPIKVWVAVPVRFRLRDATS